MGKVYPWDKVSVDGLPSLRAWLDRMDARPMVQKVLTIPKARPAAWGQADDIQHQKINAANFISDVPLD
jgi:GST-like protein